MAGFYGKWSRVRLLVVLWAGASCDPSDVSGPLFETPQAVGDAMALGLWAPSGPDTCSAEIHDGYHTVGPDAGWQACRTSGSGRMSEPEAILAAAEALLPARPAAG